jgi:hypothetical protein
VHVQHQRILAAGRLPREGLDQVPADALAAGMLQDSHGELGQGSAFRVT